MAKNTTYSFQDAIATLNFAGIIPVTITGVGAGSISISMAGEKTVHDVAADGSVMVSKVLGNNGTIAMEIQQTSSAHKLLMLWYNYLVETGSSEWANNTIVVTNKVLGYTFEATGVSPQKLPDFSMQAQGQKITWNFMCAEITQLPA